MNLTDIKKDIYKQNPTAHLLSITKSGILYDAHLMSNDIEGQNIVFLIPFTDIGDATFNKSEPAKYLIRWIIQ